MTKKTKTGTGTKLALHAETVRALGDAQLRSVGGAAKMSDGAVCDAISHFGSCWGSCSTRLWC